MEESKLAPSSNAESKLFYIGLNILSIGLLIAVCVCNAFIDYGETNEYLDIIPADFTFFVVWPIIYLFQLAWLIYGFVYFFRKDQSKINLFNKLNHIHFSLYLTTIISYIADIVWSFTNSNAIFNFITLVIMAVSQWTLVLLSMFYLNKFIFQMENFKMKRDIFLTRLLVQNGSACFATWTTIATAIGLGQLIAEKGNVNGSVASTISLSLIIVFLVLYYILDIFLLKRFFLYQYSTYLVVIWGIIGSLVEHADASKGLTRNNIIAIVILVVTVVMLAAKVVISLIYRKKFTQIDNSQINSTYYNESNKA